MSTQRGREQRGSRATRNRQPDPGAEARLIELCERMLRSIEPVLANTSPKNTLSWHAPSLSWQPAESIELSAPGHAAVLRRPEQPDRLAVCLLDLQASHGMAAMLFGGPPATGAVAPLEDALLSRLWLEAIQHPDVRWRLGTTLTRFDSLPFRSTDVVACLQFPLEVGNTPGLLTVLMSPELAAREVGDAAGTDVLPVVSPEVSAPGANSPGANSPRIRLHFSLDRAELADLSVGDIVLVTNGKRWLWPTTYSMDNQTLSLSVSVVASGLEFYPVDGSEEEPTSDEDGLLAELPSDLDETAIEAGSNLPWDELDEFTLISSGVDGRVTSAAELVSVDGNLGLRVLEWR